MKNYYGENDNQSLFPLTEKNVRENQLELAVGGN